MSLLTMISTSFGGIADSSYWLLMFYFKSLKSQNLHFAAELFGQLPQLGFNGYVNLVRQTCRSVMYQEHLEFFTGCIAEDIQSIST